MQNWHLLSIFSVTWLMLTCASPHRDVENDILRGSIAYPFVDSQPIGMHQPEDRFVIRSVVGQTEYTVEIPGAARDYDIEVPLAEMRHQLGTRPSNGLHPDHIGQPQVTDRELVGDLPRMAEHDAEGVALMDAAFGVGDAQGPMQAPSYSLGLAKVVEFYRQQQFEYALIEINNLLSFYPNSTRLLKMKGTIHMKQRELRMAEKSWAQALDLEPTDKRLEKSLERLRARLP